MPKQNVKNSLKEFEKALQEQTKKKVVLKLYVSGATKRSTRAIENIRKLCEEHLKGRYELEVIDIYQQPEALGNEQIIAAPTLVKELPPPLRRLIGDMSDMEKVLVRLDIKPLKPTKSEHTYDGKKTKKSSSESRKRS